MRVTVRLFARLRDIAGAAELARDIAPGATIGTVWQQLAAEFPDDEYRVLLPRGRAAVPRGVVPVRHPLPARLLFGAAAVSGRPRLDDLLDADVFLLPAPAPVAVGATPYVLTVHDRSWEERPEDFTPYERAWHAAARPRPRRRPGGDPARARPRLRRVQLTRRSRPSQ